MVGVGTRGIYLLEHIQECPNTDVRVICDLYDANLKRAADMAFNKKAELMKEWEKAITSPGVDAVVIATPDFWHAQMAVRAAQLGKARLRRKGPLPHSRRSEGHPQSRSRHQGHLSARPSPELRSSVPQGPRALPIRQARQNHHGADLHRPHQPLARMAVLQKLRQSGPAARRQSPDHRLGALAGRRQRQSASSTPSASSVGAAGGNTAPASQAT